MAKPMFSREPFAVTVDGEVGGGGGGMRFITGEGEPTSDIGQPGDVYLDTTTGDLYLNTNGTWSSEINLRGPEGPQGEPGPEGPEGPQGEQGPAGADGVDGQDGFPTESDWNDLVGRVEALENPED